MTDPSSPSDQGTTDDNHNQETNEGTTCEKCGKPPKGVTMWEGMEAYSCPYCGHRNVFSEQAIDQERLGRALDRLAMGFESADPHIRHEAKLVANQEFQDMASEISGSQTTAGENSKQR